MVAKAGRFLRLPFFVPRSREAGWRWRSEMAGAAVVVEKMKVFEALKGLLFGANKGPDVPTL